MFDIAFTELLVIGVVALIVLGPERLPKLARTAGQWVGKLNRYVAQVKQDIDRDMKLEELRKLQQEMKDTAQKYEILAEETREEVKKEASQVEKVVSAMATTDDDLSRKAYDELVARQGQGATPEYANQSADVAAAPTTDMSAPLPQDEAQPADAEKPSAPRDSHSRDA